MRHDHYLQFNPHRVVTLRAELRHAEARGRHNVAASIRDQIVRLSEDVHAGLTYRAITL